MDADCFNSLQFSGRFFEKEVLEFWLDPVEDEVAVVVEHLVGRRESKLGILTQRADEILQRPLEPNLIKNLSNGRQMSVAMDNRSPVCSDWVIYCALPFYFMTIVIDQ